MFGKIFRKGPNDVLRKVVFEENSSALQIHAKMRRRGRPKLAWAVEVRKVAATITVEELGSIMADETRWKNAVRKFCRAPRSMPPAA